MYKIQSYSAHRQQPKKEKLNISILTETSKLEIKRLLQTWFWILLYGPLLTEITKTELSYFFLAS